MADLAIRDAIEVAFAVVVAGTRMRPPLTPPPTLKPFLRFQKIPPAALGPVRRAVEADDQLRQRVAAVAGEELVGRAGWLWIHRPEGWEEELAALAAREAAAEQAAEEDRAERSAQRRVDAAEQAARLAAVEVAALRVEADAERQRRRQAEDDLARLERRAGQLEVELGGARRRLADAEASAKVGDEERTAVERELEALRADVARLAEVARLAAEAAAAPPSAETPTVTAENLEGAAEPLVQGPIATESARSPANAALASALAEAAEATARLTAALEAASAAAAGDSVDAEGEDRQAGTDEVPEPRPGRRSRPRRVPLALPGGMWADSPEAALHLVRAPGVLLLVDGYNVAKLGWPTLVLAEQRARVLDALDELAARYGTDVHVVFDGADVGNVPTGRRYLRVEFSPPGVTADDVIVRLAEDLPVERPIVVATNDGEVRAGARAAGANVLSSEQLLAVARR